MRVTIATLLLSLLTLAPGRAGAGGFDARPITLETRDGLGAIVISNPGERPIYLETQVFDWSQDAAGHDVLAESDAAVASPPAMWVASHATYNLRIKLPGGVPARERAFRVLIRQLPDQNDIRAGRIVFALTQSLPAFYEPPAMAPPALRASAAGPRLVLIANDGGRRARLSNLAQDGRVIAPGLIGYALPHATVSLPLPAPVHAGTIEVETDLGRRTLVLR